MNTVISRQRTLPSDPTPSHRVPRKTSSFLSLKRANGSSNVSESFYSPAQDPSAPGSYFDAYPRSTPSSRRSPKSISLKIPPSMVPEQDRKKPRGTKSRQPSESSYAFPSYPPDDDDPDLELYPSSYLRPRSRTGPSGVAGTMWVDQTEFRLSGSSTQRSETPPDTPQDTGSFGLPVLVSAPVSGVETMDALVDGMNGGEDILSSSLSRRTRFDTHHPLFHPPLPTPPPGVVLGGPKKRQHTKQRISLSDDDEDDFTTRPHRPTPPPRRKARPSNSSRGSSNTIIPQVDAKPPPPSDSQRAEDAQRSTSVRTPQVQRRATSPSLSTPKSAALSISDIIRTYTPAVQARPSLSRRVSSSVDHSPLPTVESETEVVSRSSIDSLADEIQNTLRVQSSLHPNPNSSLAKRNSTLSDATSSLASDIHQSLYTPSIYSNPSQASPDTLNFNSVVKPSGDQEVAQYLRSTRLTTLLRLTRSPHASADNPLTVSLSDLGSSTGFPVIVFLGLGCVRHIMGLYDEMAECLNLRLLTIDRWGLGRTEARSKSAKGIIQWASVVEEVLDLLRIEECSVIAHSAGGPYALSFGNKLRNRIRGDICLLAPWVGGGESGGYKWLKYVPNGILKTAQAAEWKLQAWMIGKPPTVAYEGIGYQRTPRPRHQIPSSVYQSAIDASRRPSTGTFSDYDDLQDFDGRFESRSTLGAVKPGSQAVVKETSIYVAKRKPSKGFLGRLKGSPSPSSSQPQSPSDERPATGRKLKALRSMSSLKTKSSPRSPDDISPQLPSTFKFEGGLGLDDFRMNPSFGSTESIYKGESKFSTTGSRAGGRRSISFTSPRATSLPPSPAPSTHNGSFITDGGNNYQAALGNALIAASHAESSKGTHNDLLQILNHDNHPWGFSYTSYPHKVQVWYGDKDEKIAENAVRWMERNMGLDKCTVKVVKGADHSLMYNTGVVVEVLEKVASFWEAESGKI